MRSARDLSAKEIDRCADVRTQEFDLLSVKMCPGAENRIVSFVAIQSLPNDFIQNPVDLDYDDPRLFDNA
jgi:hypothetical protein